MPGTGTFVRLSMAPGWSIITLSGIISFKRHVCINIGLCVLCVNLDKYEMVPCGFFKHLYCCCVVPSSFSYVDLPSPHQLKPFPQRRQKGEREKLET